MKKFLLFLLISQFCFSIEKIDISVIFSSYLKPYQEALDGFKEFLNEKNITPSISSYNLEKGNPEDIFLQIKEKRPKLVFTLGKSASKLAKERIEDIPVVFSCVLNPKGLASLNVTGVSLDIPQDVKLKKLKKILPNLKRIGMLYSKGGDFFYKEVLEASKSLNYKLIAMRISSPEEFPKALDKISSQIDSFLILPDPNIYFPKSVEYLLLEGLRRKFCVIGLSSSYTKGGALISFECDYKDLGRQAGEIALEILNGKSPSNIPPLRPRIINFSLNILVANALNIKIPEDYLKEAKEVFGK